MDPLLQNPDEPQLPPEPPRPRKGWVWTSWAVILLAVGAIIGVRFVQPEPAADPNDPPKRNVIFELQCRYLVGMHNLLGPLVPGLYEESQQFNRGSIEQRLCFVALAGELA